MVLGTAIGALIILGGCGGGGSGAAAPVVHNVTLTWAPSASPEASGYLVYRRAPGSLTFTLLTQLPTTSHAYVDLDVQPGQKIGYIITAVDNQMNQSPATDEVQVTIPQ